MAMGIVSDKDFFREIQDSGKDVREAPSVKRPTAIINPATIITPPTRGRKEGDNNVPNSLRNTIAQIAHTDGRDEAIAVAKDFGISESSVSAYTNGATSTASYHETPNKSVVIEAKTRVAKRARGKLMLALSKLTPEKMDEAKAIELSSIAKNMSGIVKDMEPPVEQKDSNELLRPQFIVYAPVVNQENHYDRVYVKE